MLDCNFEEKHALEKLTTGVIGIVYQEDVCWPELTVVDNLETVGKLRGLKDDALQERVEDLLVMFGLEEHAFKKASILSGGNKRKLCQAMALVTIPKVIFMDEPSNGVDPVSRKRLYTYLRNLRHTSTMLVTHRIDEAEKICSNIAIMNEGRFLAVDHPSALKEQHGTIYVMQVQPAHTSAFSVEVLNNRILSHLPFCRRVFTH